MKRQPKSCLHETAAAYSARLPEPRLRTALGGAWLGKAEEFLPSLPSGGVDLIFTSPPYALHFKK